MGAILDIIGSYVFKAAMIGIIIATSINLNEVMVEKNQLAIAEKNLNVAMSVIESDLKNIGHNYTGSSMIINARSYEIEYYADTDNNGTIEVVRWRRVWKITWPTIQINLERSVNGVGYVVVQNLSLFDIDYFKKNGEPTWSEEEVKGIRIRIKNTSPIQLGGVNITAERTFTIFPPNLSIN